MKIVIPEDLALYQTDRRGLSLKKILNEQKRRNMSFGR
jgi:hypothetical protein